MLWRWLIYKNICSEWNKKSVKVVNVIRRINEVKTLLNIVHVAVNTNLIVQHVIEAKNGITIINANVIVKSIARAKKIKIGIAAHVYLRIIGISKVDDDRWWCSNSVWWNYRGHGSTNVANIISTFVTKTVLINSDDKKILNG